MFIQLTEIITGGITAGHKRPISLNVEKISSFSPVDSKGSSNTNIQLRRGTILVEEEYTAIKETIHKMYDVLPIEE
jgi:hypothetical protein|tara:strand:- start:532 stop:759 length:228 start_codon:yes stop_codon:yes gene_type:complete